MVCSFKKVVKTCTVLLNEKSVGLPRPKKKNENNGNLF